MRLATLGCCLALTLCVACDGELALEDRPDEVAFRPSTGGGGTGGWYLNTNAIGIYTFSGLDTTGQYYDGLRLDRVELKAGKGYTVLDAVWVVDGQLFGRKGAAVYTDAQMAGSRWTVTHVQGGKVQMNLATVDAAGGGPRLYQFKYGNNTGGTPVCGADQTGDTRATLLGDLAVDTVTGDISERPNTLYLGCVSGAVGKAVTWGYTPWDLGLADFEAAVRVVRADYCGDGTSWTQPGAAVQLEDVWGVNTFIGPSAPTEAVWGEAGALCLSAPRSGQYDRDEVTCDGAPLPACDDATALASVEGGLFTSRVHAAP